MFKLIVLLVKIYIIKLYIQQVLCQAPQNWLYSQQYSFIVQAQGQSNLFSKILVSKQTGLVFVSAGYKGVQVIDPNQNYRITASLSTNDHIEGFAITQDANYVFATNNKVLNIYEFSNRKIFNSIGQDSTPVYIVDIIINQNEDTLYLFQINGIVRILDISQKTNPSFAGQILWFPQQIYGGILSTDERFLIISQDNQGVGVFYLTKVNKQVTGTFLGSYSGASQGNSHQVILTPDQNYLISLDQRNGLSFADFSLVQTKIPQNQPYQFNYYLNQWWPSQNILPSPYSFCLSQDGNFLFLGVRSIGIYTIDITDKKKPKIYMWAYFPFHGNSIALSPTSNYLYFSNSLSFMVFRKMQPTLGLKYVSLYNGNHSIGFDQSLTRYYWRCDYDPYRQVYIGAFDTDGLWLIDVSNPNSFNVLQSSYKPPNQDANIDVFLALNNYQVLITSMNDGVNFMAVLDISNYQNIQVIQQIPLGEPFYGYIKDIDYSLDYKMVVCSLDRVIVFVDTQNVRSFQVIAKWYFQPQMKGFTTGVMLSSDAKYFIGACRGYGYFVLDIQDLKNINLINYLESTGAEQVYKSLIFSYQFYLVDGLDGLYIMDQTKLPQLVSFSKLIVPGWTNDITFLNQEQTVIISTMQQGMIYLLDISDNKNPFIVSSYQYGDQNGMFTCSKQDFTTLFINNNLEVRRLPLTVSVMLHVDYIQVLGYTQSGDMQYNIIESPEIYQFQVGQTIKLNICTLYQSIDIVFSSIKFYQKQREYPLPSWIVFDPVEISLMITITNQAVDPQNLSQPLLNTLLVTTITPLYKQDFIFSQDKCSTNLEQASVIYLQFQEDGIIDDNNYVSTNIQYNSLQTIQIKDTTLFPDINQKVYMDCLSQQLKYKLLNAIQNTPIYLNIKSSLNLNTSGTTSNYISTTALSVSIQIQITKFYGQIIFRNEESINIQISADQDILNITGKVQNINEYLNKKIIIYPISPQNFNDIIAIITVMDSINYPIVNSQASNKIPFLAEKQNIQINPEKTLQTQFSDNILIQTAFEFTIDSKTFIAPDLNTTITYKVLQQKGNQYIPLENSLWLQYNSDTFKFYGTPPASAFKTSLTIQVTGSDGYTKVSQNFTIHVNQLPLMFVIQWIITILGPLTGIFGLYKFRGDLYNILFNKRNKYSKITCKPNQYFILKIPLILHENSASIQIMKELEAQLKRQETTKQQIIKIFQKKKPINQPASKKRQSWNKLLKITKFKTTILEGIGKIQEMMQANMTAIAQSYKKRLELLQKSERTSQIEKLYLKENGSIDYKLYLDHLLEFDIQFKMNNVEKSTKLLKEELSTNYSVLFQCLKSQLAIKLMCFDIKSQSVYSFLRHYSQVMNPNLTKNDWYKFLVNIKSTDDLDPFGHQIVFPEFSFYFTRLYDILTLLDFKINDVDFLYSDDLESQQKEKIYDQIYEKYDVNLYLIEQQIFADASGIVKTIPSSFFPSSGESIHIDPYQINALVALRYSPGPCICIEKTLGLDYKPYGPQGNIQLPNWLELDTQPGLIILKGIPDFSNSEGILIRITTLEGYIIKHFILNVEEDVVEYKKLKQQLYKKKYIHNSKNQKFNQLDSYNNQQKLLAYSIYREKPSQDSIFFNPKQNLPFQQITHRSLTKQNSKSITLITDVDIQEEDHQISGIKSSEQKVIVDQKMQNLDNQITQPTLLTENQSKKNIQE
ncbi:calpain family cysteine protease (macronuclear) [Tetrahymena thermophila SB210]|uniref:Calpain family cysteine protease n=1 Tax=Tetrahymena thermophila (strain SB210) TaxID=312017 RepID=I7MCT9_TETTS|nr:calpain family cysteine protease [Tetrahymena thermophila SB210]EAR84918.2 calpain family cysteine protease [Tetrahymena thermophila SB210]|eukprot:XP_001032581.2 calpain family cysteine protease [Tetrahymena thermophila SB210]